MCNGNAKIKKLPAPESQLSVSYDPRFRTQGMETTILRTLGTLTDLAILDVSGAFCDLELGTI